MWADFLVTRVASEATSLSRVKLVAAVVIQPQRNLVVLRCRAPRHGAEEAESVGVPRLILGGVPKSVAGRRVEGGAKGSQCLLM